MINAPCVLKTWSERVTNKCSVCGRIEWRQLPPPSTELVITTAGKLVPGPLNKAQCSQCGAVQRVETGRLADTDYYERHYTYYERPGADTLDVVRYQALARWVEDAIAPRRPLSVFDVGCGQGGTMRYLRESWPDAAFAGLEPYPKAVDAARALGFDVAVGRLALDEPLNRTFDLVFSNNVLQHTTDPVAFIRAQARLLAPDGRLVLSCPDGTHPSVELLMADQNFSLCPPHLDAVAAQAGMRVERRLACPGGPLRNEQLVVLVPFTTEKHQQPVLPTREAVESAYGELAGYMKAWADLDAYLLQAVGNARRTFNLGGGLWSYVLAAYCPRYWAQVECCLVDGHSGQCLEKEVKPFDSVALSPDDVIVFGTNPYVQTKLVNRMTEAGMRCVSWNHIIPH
jgi:SAM-dependent methyltransferase